MLIIGNGRLVTRDASQPFFENGAVAVEGTEIMPPLYLGSCSAGFM